jgi:hypothetical protein
MLRGETGVPEVASSIRRRQIFANLAFIPYTLHRFEERPCDKCHRAVSESPLDLFMRKAAGAEVLSGGALFSFLH